MNTNAAPTISPINLHPDLDRGPRKAVFLLVGSLALLMFFGLIGMNYATLDIAVNASGSVIPSSRVLKIQSLEGGIIREFFVQEGQQVKKGDRLAYIENLFFDSELGENKQNYWGMLATIARLNAELEEREISFSSDILEHAPEIAEKERQLLVTQQNEYKAAIDGAQNSIDQRYQELAEGRARVKGLERNLELAHESLEMERQLMEQGAGARSDFLTAQQTVSRLTGELTETKISISRFLAAVGEVKAKKREVKFKYRTEASRQRNELQTKIGALSKALNSMEDKVQRRSIVSPMNGIVNRILISSVGGVAMAGDIIMEIVPAEDNLLFSVQVKPSDIAFIRKGQNALIRITAYDSSIYGTLEGKVVRVGADAVLNERKEPFYDVFLETPQKFVDGDDESLPIMPGMMSDTSILTGKRTLLEYMLKPIVKTFKHSLQER